MRKFVVYFILSAVILPVILSGCTREPDSITTATSDTASTITEEETTGAETTEETTIADTESILTTEETTIAETTVEETTVTDTESDITKEETTVAETTEVTTGADTESIVTAEETTEAETTDAVTGTQEDTQTESAAENIMSYSEKELEEINKYLKYSAGADVSLHKSKSDTRNLFSCTVSDICEIPETSMLKYSGYIKYNAYIAFSTDGNQNLTVKGVDKVDMTVTYNELHTEKYTSKTVFKANVFYKIEIGFSYSEGITPKFTADSAYKLSLYPPSFGGVPSEKVTPIADIHMRDTFITVGADGKYYMTGTYDPVDWANTREIHVYRSDNIYDWVDLGCVWSYERDATWQKQIIKDGTSPVWAPELHYINGDYYICYSLGWGSLSGSVLKSKTGLPEGPYEDICGKAIFDYIDSTFFVDDDGTVYAIWSDGLIAKMSEDMTKLTTRKKALVSESGLRVGFEGCYMIKINGLYYLCSATYTIHYREDGSKYQSYDSYYAVSDKIEGPYSERRLLLINGGHNNLFYSNDGKLYTTAFFGESFSEKPAIAEVEVTENGLLKIN